ncbi:Radical SAM domain protein [Modestobacter italicus]|uniref:Radical SAM domain protein n=1 Tax=Modestobacter italicus (strain DSM 44449 / CECT 9708 / BC 501) TaxID=2732864 RepID=I4EXD6_MODI5|nr:Rv2578c family radical SAM protein [Modestobacter marinus]CCH88049.1 Radical SAM domain protein [Modestobacter marinus]
MRWDAQRLDFAEPDALPGLPTVRGLLRSVEVPEFPGLTFHEVRAKSALNAVPKGSAMPFGHTINTFRGCSHACVYCVAGDTAVLMADGSQRAIADLRVGDRIIGTEKRGSYRFYVETEVLAHWSTVKPAYRVRLADGTALVASGDHRFLTGRGWRHVTGSVDGRPYLGVGEELSGLGASLATAPRSSRAGDRREPVAVLERRPLLVGTLVRGDPELTVTAVDDLAAEMPMFDITTSTGDFIANGVVSHNCFARGTHEWLELDTGKDFDQQIVVKTNVVEVLRRELARPSWNHEHVALGTNTDPYQRAEGRYRLMPGVIDALARSGTPFSILTKGTLARRDLPLLAAASRDVPIGMGVSMAIWDDDLHTALEPGAPTPRARLDLVRAITDAGLPCGVFLAPVLPGLTDGRAHLAAAIGAIAEAGATGVTVLPLHLRPGAREWFTSWLAREHPGLVGRYRQLYGRGAYVPAEYRRWLAGRVGPLLAEHGLDRHSGGTARGLGGSDTGLPGDESVGFPAGSLPVRLSGPSEPPPEAAEQLSLC